MKRSAIALIAAGLLALSACSSGSDSDDNGASGDNGSGSENVSGQKIRVGFGVGMYEEMFKEVILPILEEEGLEIETTTLSQNIQLNPAMAEGSLDLTIFQNTSYMDSIAHELDFEMARLNFIPSAPQGLYSDNHDSLDEAGDGTSVVIPQDPATLYRGMELLEDIGWVEIDEDADLTNFSTKDLKSTKYEFDWEPLDLAQAITSLPDVDYALINGNYITTSGRLISENLAVEKTMTDENQLITSIAADDVGEPWTKVVEEAYNSDEFKDYILDNPKYEDWVMPPNW